MTRRFDGGTVPQPGQASPRPAQEMIDSWAVADRLDRQVLTGGFDQWALERWRLADVKKVREAAALQAADAARLRPKRRPGSTGFRSQQSSWSPWLSRPSSWQRPEATDD